MSASFVADTCLAYRPIKPRCPRRSWTTEEKRQIVAETRTPGVSVSSIARRHGLNANQLFNWIRDPRFNAPPNSPVLLPVDVATGHVPPVEPPSRHCIEIELRNGVRLRCDADALARVLNVIGRSS